MSEQHPEKNMHSVVESTEVNNTHQSNLSASDSQKKLLEFLQWDVKVPNKQTIGFNGESRKCRSLSYLDKMNYDVIKKNSIMYSEDTDGSESNEEIFVKQINYNQYTSNRSDKQNEIQRDESTLTRSNSRHIIWDEYVECYEYTRESSSSTIDSHDYSLKYKNISRTLSRTNLLTDDCYSNLSNDIYNHKMKLDTFWNTIGTHNGSNDYSISHKSTYKSPHFHPDHKHDQIININKNQRPSNQVNEYSEYMNKFDNSYDLETIKIEPLTNIQGTENTPKCFIYKNEDFIDDGGKLSTNVPNNSKLTTDRICQHCGDDNTDNLQLDKTKHWSLARKLDKQNKKSKYRSSNTNKKATKFNQQKENSERSTDNIYYNLEMIKHEPVNIQNSGTTSNSIIYKNLNCIDDKKFTINEPKNSKSRFCHNKICPLCGDSHKDKSKPDKSEDWSRVREMIRKILGKKSEDKEVLLMLKV